MTKFSPPKNFPFEKPAEWPKWNQRFEWYRLAMKQHKDDGEVQVCCLIYAMGAEVENNYKSFTFARNDERNDFTAVMRKFDTSTSSCGGILSMSGYVSTSKSSSGEKAKRFIRALYDLSEHCDFGATKEENSRDRIVVRIRDK